MSGIGAIKSLPSLLQPSWPWVVHAALAPNAPHLLKTDDRDPDWKLSIFGGALTGIIEATSTFPLEYIKTQLQLDEKGKSKKYQGPMDCFRKTIRYHGVFGLYRGLLPMIYGSCLRLTNLSKSNTYNNFNLVLELMRNNNRKERFGVFEYTKSIFTTDGHTSSKGNFISGLLAGFVESIVIVTPVESIKVQLIEDGSRKVPRFKGLLQIIRYILTTHGIRGFYGGLVPTALRQGTNQAVRFLVMETLKDLYKSNTDHDKPVPKLLVGCFGAVAGATSVLCNSPIDLVKTRMQGIDAHKYINSWDCFLKTWRREGFFALYKGTLTRLIKETLNAGFTFISFEIIMDILTKI